MDAKNIRHLSLLEVAGAATALAVDLHRRGFKGAKIWGIPRGGVSAAYALAVEDPSFRLVARPQDADILIDDLFQSGATAQLWESQTARGVAALFTKQHPCQRIFGYELPTDEWVIFPWEGDAEGSAEDIPRRLLQFIGEDPSREGLRETPARFLRAWQHKTKGYKEDAAQHLKVFEPEVQTVRGMVVVRDIEIETVCEHHLERVWGYAHIGYVPKGRVIGLSKLSRVASVFSRRLQIQERLAANIADALLEHLEPQGVGVVIEARHACMEVRGIEQRGAVTVTSELRGCFYDDSTTRAEFLNLARTSKTF